MTRSWFVTVDRQLVNWAVVVVARRAVVTIYQVVIESGSRNETRFVWARGGERVADYRVEQAKALASTDPLPAAYAPPASPTAPSGGAAGLAAVATSGAYADLSGRPTIPTTATQVGAAATVHTHTAAQVSDATSVGRAVLTAADALTARTALSAAPTTHTHTAAQIADASATGRALLAAADAAAARTAIGATDTPAPATDPAAGTAGLRTLGAGAQQAAAGNDPRFTTVPATAQGGAAYTLVAADAGRVVEVTSAAAATVTVPANTTTAIPVGTVVEVYQYGAGQVTINPAAGVTLRSAAGLKTSAQYASATLRKRAADEWVVAGAVTA